VRTCKGRREVFWLRFREKPKEKEAIARERENKNAIGEKGLKAINQKRGEKDIISPAETASPLLSKKWNCGEWEGGWGAATEKKIEIGRDGIKTRNNRKIKNKR